MSSPVIEKVNCKSLKSKSRSVIVDSSDGSSSEEDLGLEASRLQKHQDSIRSRSYAAAATTQDPDCFIVSQSQSNSDSYRLRPRPVFVHVGSVRPRVLIDKLGAHSIVPYQVQVLLNSDLAVTFKSIEDKQAFLKLDCVVTSELPLSRPVWVRLHFKPAEHTTSEVKDRMNQVPTCRKCDNSGHIAKNCYIKRSCCAKTLRIDLYGG